MNTKIFREYLSLYGADLKKWPEAARQEAMEALRRDMECKKLHEAEKKFEETLRSAEVPNPLADLARRITARAASLSQESPPASEKNHWGLWLGDLFRPRVVAACAALLVLGICLGFLLRGEINARPSAMDLAALFNNQEMIWNIGSNTSY